LPAIFHLQAVHENWLRLAAKAAREISQALATLVQQPNKQLSARGIATIADANSGKPAQSRSGMCMRGALI
jgi:hypothetical protein